VIYTEYRDEGCPVCKHRGWCGKAEDGSVVINRREPKGASYTGADKNGAPFYVHSLVADDADDEAPVKPAAKRSGRVPSMFDSLGVQVPYTT
jgi:hypothetical protein